MILANVLLSKLGFSLFLFELLLSLKFRKETGTVFFSYNLLAIVEYLAIDFISFHSSFLVLLLAFEVVVLMFQLG